MWGFHSHHDTSRHQIEAILWDGGESNKEYMRDLPEPVSISVSTVFGRRVYFPQISFVVLGDTLMVTATLDQKTERENGWPPTVVMEMIQRVTTDGIHWNWSEVERDIAMREWSVIGTKNVLVGNYNIVNWETP